MVLIVAVTAAERVIKDDQQRVVVRQRETKRYIGSHVLLEHLANKYRKAAKPSKSPREDKSHSPEKNEEKQDSEPELDHELKSKSKPKAKKLQIENLQAKQVSLATSLSSIAIVANISTEEIREITTGKIHHH